MTTTVTMDLYSGRANPVLQLSDQQEAELERRLTGLGTATAQRPSGALGGLGYRGFLVNRHDAHAATAAPSLRIHEAIVDHGVQLPNLVDDTKIEHFLLDAFRPQLHADAISHVQQQLSAAAAAAFALHTVAAACPTCHAADAPVYNPGPWNTPATQPHNNCYNYANNQITNTFAQPGRAHGHQATVMDCAHVQPAAVADGLVAVPNFNGTLHAGAGWYVALVIWPGNDYHWYRQDKVGCWSHKPGGTAARNTDNAGHAISDPKTCNRGPYTVFCTYMVTKHGVVIR
jgi:hypothetical protein